MYVNNENNLVCKSIDYPVSNEEFENLLLTNQIINKSNIDLKNQIKDLENEIQYFKESNNKNEEMSRIIENINKNLLNYEGRVKESSEYIESLKKVNSDLALENKRLNKELEGINGNFEFADKTKDELRQQINILEEINSKSDHENDLLSVHLKEKDRIWKEFLASDDKKSIDEEGENEFK